MTFFLSFSRLKMWLQRPDQSVMHDPNLSLADKLNHHFTHRKSMFDEAFMNKWGPRSVVAMILTGTPLGVLVVLPDVYEDIVVLRIIQVRHFTYFIWLSLRPSQTLSLTLWLSMTISGSRWLHLTLPICPRLSSLNTITILPSIHSFRFNCLSSVYRHIQCDSNGNIQLPHKSHAFNILIIRRILLSVQGVGARWGSTNEML